MTRKLEQAVNCYFSHPGPHERAWAEFRRLYPGKPILGDASGKPFIKFTSYEIPAKDSKSDK